MFCKSKIVIALILISIINAQYIFGVSYLYEKKNSYSKLESSISTVATPSFTFESYSQVLMEPSTGKILYANNEKEKMLPASVTKVMTILLIMEQIDSGILDYTDTVTCSKKASEMGGSQIWFYNFRKRFRAKRNRRVLWNKTTWASRI